MVSAAIVTTVHPWDDVRIYQKEARALAAAGHPVTLYCPGHGGFDDLGIRFVPLTLPESRAKRMAFGWRIALKRVLAGKDSLVFLHDPELLPMIGPLRRAGRLVLYDAHEDLPRQILSKPWLPSWLRPAAASLAGCYETHALSRADQVLAATETIAGRFPGAVCFHNYPDPGELSPGSVPHAGRPRELCYVGSISRSRGLFPMVQALAGTDAVLHLAGTPEEKTLVREAEALPGGKQLHFLGRISRREVAGLLRRCRAGMLVLQPTPAYRESLPIKLFEYLLAGLPVVASDFPLWRSLAGDSALYVDPVDAGAIRGAVLELLDHPDLAQAMGERGRQRVLENYSLAREQEKLLAVCRRLEEGLK